MSGYPLTSLGKPKIVHDVPTATPTSTAYQLADIKLAEHGGVADYIATKRTAGRSWRLISRDLYEDTGLDITFETLRRWFPETETKAAS